MAPRKSKTTTVKPGRTFRGDRLRFIREKMNMTQPEMEKFLGFGTGVVSRYENNISDPLPNQLVMMAQKLQVTADWLLGLTDDPEGYNQTSALTRDERLLINKYRSGELIEMARDLLSEALVKNGDTAKDAPNQRAK